MSEPNQVASTIKAQSAPDMSLERKYRRIVRGRKARGSEEPLELSPNELKALFAERRARIIAFSDLNTRRRRWIGLAWVIDELSTRVPDGSKTAYRDKKREADVIRHVQAAIRGGDFSRANPGDMKHERLLFLSPSESFHFISRDEAISIGDMPNVDHVRDVIVRMWVPRGTLATLFEKREWRPPAWLQSKGIIPPSSTSWSRDTHDEKKASYPTSIKLVNPIPNQGPRRAARLALDALFPKGVPIQKTGQQLTNAVNNYLQHHRTDLVEGRVKQTVSIETVLRAAERK